MVDEYLRDHPQFEEVLMRCATSEDISMVDMSSLTFENCLEAPPESEVVASVYDNIHSYTPRKFDYARREFANRRLGKLGEDFVVELEKDRLVRSGKPELAVRVTCVSEKYGDGLGYDVASFEADGSDKCIEVKTTRFGKAIPFFLSANELNFSVDHPHKACLYRVFNFNKSPKLFVIAGSLRNHCKLIPQLYLASL